MPASRLGLSSAGGFRSGPLYRTVGEEDILDHLLLFGWAFEPSREEGRETLNRLIRDGLPYAQVGDSRRFDPAELVNFIKQASLERGDSLWEDRFVATGRRLAEEVPLSGERDFSVTLARDFDLAHLRPGTRVRLRLPLPLEPHAIEPRLTAGLDAEITAAPGRLDACFNRGAEPQVTLSARIALRTRPGCPDGAAPLDAAEAELYTRPRESRLVVSPRIRALSAELSEGAGDPDRIIDRFWAFLLDRLAYGMVHHDRLSDAAPLDALLDDGWYDCHLGSALFAALCRASGIPARLVGGYLLYPTAPSSHYWAEAWLADRGWVPFDLACWDLSAGGRDAFWRNRFFGRLDYRMRTEVMPRLFTGTPSLRFPAGWHRLQRLEPEGASVSFRALDSGALIFRDRITVKA